MREIPEPITRRVFESPVREDMPPMRVVVERHWQPRQPANGHRAFDPVVLVYVLLGQTTAVFTTDRFAAYAEDLAAVAGRVREAAAEILKHPGSPPAVNPQSVSEAVRQEPQA